MYDIVIQYGAENKLFYFYLFIILLQWRWSTFAETPNVAQIFCVIWKDLWWRADSYHHFKHRGGSTIPLFQISVWCEECIADRHFTVIGKQLLISNDRNRVRCAVLGLSLDRACTDSFKKFQCEELKGRQIEWYQI